MRSASDSTLFYCYMKWPDNCLIIKKTPNHGSPQSACLQFPLKSTVLACILFCQNQRVFPLYGSWMDNPLYNLAQNRTQPSQSSTELSQVPPAFASTLF